MLCPFCRSDLKTETRSGVEIEICSQCNALWFDGNEFGMYKARGTTTKIEDLQMPTGLRCPKCVAELLATGMACGVPVNYCNRCNGISIEANSIPAAAAVGGYPLGGPQQEHKFGVGDGLNLTDFVLNTGQAMGALANFVASLVK